MMSGCSRQRAYSESRFTVLDPKVAVVTVLKRTGTPSRVATFVAVVELLPKFPRSM
jgi:hypothetical protein